MATLKVTQTYGLVTHELVESGEDSEIGYIVNGQRWPLGTEGADQPDTYTASEFIEAVKYCTIDHIQLDRYKLTVYCAAEVDYRTGDSEARAWHVRGDTRLLKAVAKHLHAPSKKLLAWYKLAR